MAKISLTASMRSNLLSLQKTSSLMDLTQERLSTGKKVNSAIDNPSSFYTARSLNNRASDLDALLDSMGQGIQTIKAATTAIETATSFLEQAKAVATQVLDESGNSLSKEDKLQDFIDDGYEVISAGASANDIKQMITNGATKLVLADDLVLDAPLEISESDIIINGNGNKISYSGGDNLLKFTGSGVELSNIELNYTSTNGAIYSSTGAILASNGAEITLSDITIKTSGDYVHGVVAEGGSQITLDTAKNISTNGELARKVFNADAAVAYDGEMNTKLLVEGQTTVDTPAADAAYNYYVVSESDANFGKGTWYLPSIGELADGLYGTDTTQILDNRYWGSEGADAEHFNTINTALGKLGSDAEQMSGVVWSSSEDGDYLSWRLDTSNGYRDISYDKYSILSVRSFQLLENCFTDGGAKSADGSNATPKIGDIMYADFTYSSADDYDTYKGSKTAVGIIVSLSEDGSSAKIMSLKNLGTMQWGGNGTDISGMKNFASENWGTFSIITVGGSENLVAFSLRRDAGGGEAPADGYDISQYQKILNQYDDLIGDAKYKGVNLLKNEMLKIKFNETGDAFLDVVGKDISAANIGLTTTEWATVEDVSRSIGELTSAIGQLRAFSGELGNNYSIVMNRQDFTENLINILTEGSDKLTLADMNEESANMLALQTRQQLAINALSLASQASQGVLKLF